MVWTGRLEPQVLLYMARAYYDWDHLQECKRTLLRALHLKPTDHRLRFDIALSMQVRLLLETSQL